MQKRVLVKNVFYVLAGLLAACSLQIAPLRAQALEGEQAAWESLGITSYHVVIDDMSLWNRLTLDVWIVDSSVKQLVASCEPSLLLPTCDLGIVNVSGYSIDALFVTAQDADERLANIEFDPEYHYPSQISLDNKQALDDERVLRIMEFEPIDATDIADGDAMALPTPEDSEASVPLPTAIPSWPLTPQVIEGELTTAVDRAESMWTALQVDSYSLELSEIGVWNGMRLAMTVQEGRAVRLSARCEVGWLGGPCGLWTVDTDSYVIQGLFARAREAAEVDWDAHDVVSLDAAIGIPLMIYYDEEMTADEEWQLQVTQFTLLEPPIAVPAS